MNICVWNHDVQHTEGSRKPTTLHGLCFFHVFVNLYVFFWFFQHMEFYMEGSRNPKS